MLAIFGSEGLIQLLLGAYGPIAQLAPAVYSSLFFKKANALSVIIGLILGVTITVYYQYFSEASILDMHAGLIGLVANILVIIVLSIFTKQNAQEKNKSIEFMNI